MSAALHLTCAPRPFLLSLLIIHIYTGPNVFGNFSIPMDSTSGNNFTIPTFGGMPGTMGMNGSMMGALPGDLPGLQNATDAQEPAAAPAKAKSSAGGFSSGALPVLAAAAAAAALLVL